MDNTPGTVTQVSGLSGLPLIIALVMMFACVLAALCCVRMKRRRSTAALFVGAALVLLYLMWSVWPVIVIALVLLVVGTVVRLSVFSRLRRALSAALREVREPVDGDPVPADPPAAAE